MFSTKTLVNGFGGKSLHVSTVVAAAEVVLQLRPEHSRNRLVFGKLRVGAVARLARLSRLKLRLPE